MRYAPLVTVLGLGLATSPAWAQSPVPPLYPATCFHLESRAPSVFDGAWGARPRADFMTLRSWHLDDYGWWPDPTWCSDDPWWAYIALDLFVSFWEANLDRYDRGVYYVGYARPTDRTQPRVAYKEPPEHGERSAKRKPASADAGEPARPRVTAPAVQPVRPTPLVPPVRPIPRVRPAPPRVTLHPPRPGPRTPPTRATPRRSGISFGSVVSGLIHLLRPGGSRGGGSSVSGAHPRATHGRPAAGRTSRPKKPARRRSGGGGSER